jgi:hypothetical protein
MRRNRLRLKVLSSAPCPQPWDAMQGNHRERHCASCDKRVHNFAAMTAREVEELVCKQEGRLCARVTYRHDGSIRTIDGPSQPSVASSMVLAVSLALATPAAAESRSETPTAAKATLTGTVLLQDGSGPLVDGLVVLRSDQQAVAVAHTDAHGNFAISAQPGHYDISIGRNILFGFHIRAADLHEGEQSLQPLRVSFQRDSDYDVETVTGGQVIATYIYPTSYLFKHPVRYMKHLLHKL